MKEPGFTSFGSVILFGILWEEPRIHEYTGRRITAQCRQKRQQMNERPNKPHKTTGVATTKRTNIIQKQTQDPKPQTLNPKP